MSYSDDNISAYFRLYLFGYFIFFFLGERNFLFLLRFLPSTKYPLCKAQEFCFFHTFNFQQCVHCFMTCSFLFKQDDKFKSQSLGKYKYSRNCMQISPECYSNYCIYYAWFYINQIKIFAEIYIDMYIYVYKIYTYTPL